MVKEILQKLQIKDINSGAYIGGLGSLTNDGKDILDSINPTNNEKIASVINADIPTYQSVIGAATTAFLNWRTTPAPKRGEIVRQIGVELRLYKNEIAQLITIECGKTINESLGEVQEMIDLADFACGLSRQLYGLTMHSERPNHRMYEQWHPLGVVGTITAFNFPAAVWSWNALIAAVCGNTNVWKPSPKTPLTAIAIQHICDMVSKRNNITGVFNLIIGKNESIGEQLIHDNKINLVSFTGSSKVGRYVGEQVSKRFGKSLLELGGNNALIIDESADLNLALPTVLFGAIGTSGQRCTTTRRLLVHKNLYQSFVNKLVEAYKQIRIGDPSSSNTLMGPLIDQYAVELFEKCIQNAKNSGAKVIVGGSKIDIKGNFVLPTLIEATKEMQILQDEHFVPILYVLKFDTIEEAIEINNSVAQGLSSSVFTNNFYNSELFLSAAGSDCGIANVNVGTSGAEIGGAFGGEKETGGGRESGSDAWKAYMRRQTNTINWGKDLPLAQGIKFEI
ncbi:MAG: aldehyde dehydrogenase family protein [Bacteroidota bacterium]|nr:aldehyde dehydrogenase family protein [Bacteroidota bacterium]